MILAEIILCGLLLSLLTGGSLRELASEPLKYEWLLLALLPMQMAWPELATRMGLSCSVALLIWLLMMGALALVLMLNAPRRWMLAFAALGIAANVLVIGLNQGMPVDIRRASEIGASRREARGSLEDDCLHEELDEGSALPLLADVVAIPGPRWQSGVVSIGDLLLALGLGSWIFAASREHSTK